MIRLGDQPMLPFSTKQTCLPCHDYDKISNGWHFNAGQAHVPPGRHGQPWILADQVSATQIPLSLRPWPGTFRPEQLGLSTLQFVQIFGRHMPGGGVGENEESKSAESYLRWMVSGNLEVNCLSCHDAERAHDQAEYAAQIARQNFRWAASASSGFATARGAARDMPDNYSIYGSLMDNSTAIPPTVSYDSTRFNRQNKVFFDVVRKIPNERCYFCHSTKNLGARTSEKWHSDEDVHLVAGMMCVDCHRNGLDHNMVRGYEGEADETGNSFAATLTCHGCHLGDESAEIPVAGRLGAPRPKHAGIPPVHFEKLACTACHSGAWPDEQSQRVKTSQAHGLGTHGVNKSEMALPHIISPVFIEQADGTIAPHRMFWPAFWARLDSNNVTPLDFQNVRAIAATVVERDSLGTGDWPKLNSDQIIEILRTLIKQDSAAAQPVYISGGKLYRLDQSGKLAKEDHPAAQPYSWPFAHDVRPAAQSLGVRGCDDCHSLDAPIYFGKVAIDSPLESERTSTKTMVEFAGINGFYARVFALSFVLRPWLKTITFLASLILGAIVILYAFKGLTVVLESTEPKKKT